MRIIAFINEGPMIRTIPGHLDLPSSDASLIAARGPGLSGDDSTWA
jgi:hypothetical protein